MSRTLKHTLWFFMAVNIILLAPCAVVGTADLFDLIFSGVYRIYIWQYNKLTMFAMPFIIARCFYMNYVLFSILVILQIVYIFKLKKWKYQYNYKVPAKEKIIYIGVWVILLIGFLSAEHMFWGAMSV